MAKQRTTIPTEVADLLLFQSNSTCCVCRESGRPVQIHHLDENPTNHVAENLVVLCLICHDQTQIVGGFGRKLSAGQLRLHRAEWHEAVVRIRRRATEIAAGESCPGAPSRADLVPYVRALPQMLAHSRALARESAEAKEAAIEQAEADYAQVEVLAQMLTRLSGWLPDGALLPSAPQFVSANVQTRLQWNHALAEPTGEGGFGTFILMATLSRTIADLERDVATLSGALLFAEGRRDEIQGWLEEWPGAKP